MTNSEEKTTKILGYLKKFGDGQSPANCATSTHEKTNDEPVLINSFHVVLLNHQSQTQHSSCQQTMVRLKLNDTTVTN
jgi:hypothetical protein